MKNLGKKSSWLISAVCLFAAVALGVPITAFAAGGSEFTVLDMRLVTQTIFWAMLAAGLVILAFGILRIKRTKEVRKIGFGLLSIALVLVLIFNAVVSQFSVVIDMYLAKNNIDKQGAQESRSAAELTTAEIEAEGIVLLENKNNALPIPKGNINVFGYSSRSFVFGGTGSGGGDEVNNTSLQKGLENAGFSVNPELTAFYDARFVPREAINIHNLVGGDFNCHEPAVSEYSEELLNSSKAFSDTAVVVFARNSGEGADLATNMANYVGGTADKHYLELADPEIAMLNMVKSNFDKVIVLLNSSYPMELKFLQDGKIDAALWVGGPGSTGCTSIGRVLTGEVNPSGRLVDTYAYDATSAPSYYNIGEFPYSNSVLNFGENTWYYKYVEYVEGIYSGYRYYETRYINNETKECDEAAYAAAVQYPFGYGLSYSTFSQKIKNFTADKKTITVDVEVTNTGKVAGKEVVQLYFTAPYTGGIEKSHVILGGFGKTSLLNPASSETVTIQIAVEDMASYDYQKAKAYVLEAGDYEIKLSSNAHKVTDSRTYTVDSTIVYNSSNKRASDMVAATNLFDDVAGDIVYVSRADWEGTLPTKLAEPKEASAELLAKLEDLSSEIDASAAPITFAKNGLTLYEMQGLAYDDPKWELLLQQLSVEDMAQLITVGGFQTVALPSIGKPASLDSDGPAGINHLITGAKGNRYTSEVVVASTWNVELAKSMGASMGAEAVAHKISGFYAPAANIHRSPFSGRNFEYYSEDALLSGKMASAVVQGAKTKGCYTYIKHFVLYDQETMRYTTPTGAATWSNEQAMREIYLKPFEIAVKEGGSTAYALT